MKKKITKTIKAAAKKPATNKIAELENVIAGLQMRLDLAEAAIQALRDSNRPAQKWPNHWPAWPNSPTWNEWPIYYGVRSAGG